MTRKQLCIVIRYYSKKLSQIITTFAGIIHIEAGDSLTIANALLTFLDDNKLSILNCIRLATDGCNTMCGQHNSVLQKFHYRNPHIVYRKCVCHSLCIKSCQCLAQKCRVHGLSDLQLVFKCYPASPKIF